MAGSRVGSEVGVHVCSGSFPGRSMGWGPPSFLHAQLPQWDGRWTSSSSMIHTESTGKLPDRWKRNVQDLPKSPSVDMWFQASPQGRSQRQRVQPSQEDQTEFTTQISRGGKGNWKIPSTRPGLFLKGFGKTVS